jgi:hypothetical protein
MISSRALSSFSDEMSKESVLGTLASQLLRKAMTPGVLRLDPDNARRAELRKALLKGEAVEVRYQHEGSGEGPYYSNTGGKPYVSVRSLEDPGILAHELGHAEIDRSGFGKLLQSSGLRGVATVGAVGGTVLGMMGSSPSHRTIGAVIALASTTPILGAEGWASAKAINKLRAAGATESEVSAAKSRLLKAFGTYATVPAGILGDIATASMLGHAA